MADIRNLEDGSTVLAKKTKGGCIQAQGTMSILPGTLKYWEVTLLYVKDSQISIGIAPLGHSGIIGMKESVGLESERGQLLYKGSVETYLGRELEQGDTIGVGWDSGSNELFFTLNGLRFPSIFVAVGFVTPLHPSIYFQGPEAAVSFNFLGYFRYEAINAHPVNVPLLPSSSIFSTVGGLRTIDIGLQEAIVCSDERFPAGAGAYATSALPLTDLCPGLGCLPGSGGQLVVLGYFEVFVMKGIAVQVGIKKVSQLGGFHGQVVAEAAQGAFGAPKEVVDALFSKFPERNAQESLLLSMDGKVSGGLTGKLQIRDDHSNVIASPISSRFEEGDIVGCGVLAAVVASSDPPVENV